MKVIDYCPCCGSASIAKTFGFISPFVTCRIFGCAPVNRHEHFIKRFGLTRITWLKKQLAKRFLVHMQTGVLICSDCEFICSDVRFDSDEMARYYDDFMGPSYTAARIKIEPEFAMIRQGIY